MLPLTFLMVLTAGLASINFRDSDINFNSPIDMRGNEITNLADPTQPDSAAPASWTGDKFVNKSGDNITGDLNLNENQITNLSNPDDPGDVPTKDYVDSISSGGDLGYTESVEFTTPNSSHNYTVPDWADKVKILVIGGSGGDGGGDSPGAGGEGGRVNATIDVTGGENLTVYVGENGEDGASDIGGEGGASPMAGIVEGGKGGDGSFTAFSGGGYAGGGGGAPSAVYMDGSPIAVGEGGGGGEGENTYDYGIRSGGGGGGARGGSGGDGGDSGDPGEDGDGSGDGGDGGDGSGGGSDGGSPGGTYADSTTLDRIETGSSSRPPSVILFPTNEGGRVLTRATYKDTCWDTDEAEDGATASASCEVKCPERMTMVIRDKWEYTDTCNDDYSYRCTDFARVPHNLEDALDDPSLVWEGGKISASASVSSDDDTDAYAEVAGRGICRAKR